MSTYGLQIYDASGGVVFDSTQASGGVCVDIVTVPNTGADVVYTYPDMGTGYSGIPVNVIGDSSYINGVYYDEALGYPRFTCKYWTWGNVFGFFLI